ncbi:MAG TPA: RidA family protein [Candidatus Thalassarchaeaceae archaeon]|jgi:2-iminobutanoate/2-iminopropanoate deaminase|nr:RidA family protein [Candidatus Thalassarchaeaceae archaeon]|tara:strand:- start:76764 stop:77180 length:417 start_codon:yes stop_codon:yes gene_type:complete
MGRKLKIDTGEIKLGPYSPGINVRDHIWLSGQIDVQAGEDITSQTLGTLAKIDDLLAAANSSKGDLVKVTVLMTDIGFYSEINELYSGWLGDTIPPARAAYEVSNLPGGALVEIVCEAFRNSGEFRTDLPAELEEALV